MLGILFFLIYFAAAILPAYYEARGGRVWWPWLLAGVLIGPFALLAWYGVEILRAVRRGYASGPGLR